MALKLSAGLFVYGRYSLEVSLLTTCVLLTFTKHFDTNLVLFSVIDCAGTMEYATEYSKNS